MPLSVYLGALPKRIPCRELLVAAALAEPRRGLVFGLLLAVYLV